MPRWRADVFRANPTGKESDNSNAPEVVLLVDTFNTYFEPENARAALAVLQSAGYRVHVPRISRDARPLCCGRTFLASGLIAEAKAEAGRLLDALTPYIERGLPIIGLEPSCLYSLRDEYAVLQLGPSAQKLSSLAILFEEFLARELAAGKLTLNLKSLPVKRALLHGHCHQKAFDGMGAVERTLRMVPGLEVQRIESSCCGMAGAFGYDANHFDVSMKMGELNLLPAVRAADSETLVVADGTSCRQQIRDGAKREALHVARVLQQALRE